MRVVGGVLTQNKNRDIRYQSLEIRLKTQRVSESQRERVKARVLRDEIRDVLTQNW